MTKLSNLINRQRMFVGWELGNDTADLLEEQAREIEKLKVALAKRVLTADEQRKDFDGLLKNWSKQGYEIKELRAALVDCQRMLHYVKPRVDVDTQNAINLAITRSIDLGKKLEAAENLENYMEQYPHMVKGYMWDAITEWQKLK